MIWISSVAPPLGAIPLLALTFAFVATSPVSAASGGCDYGSPDILRFVRWEFVKRDGAMRELRLTYRNNLNQSFAWVDLRLLVDGGPIGFNKRQRIPAASEAVLTAQYEMSDEAIAKFQSRTPLICVLSIEDEKGSKRHYD
jgi:hypothetical protein